MAEIEIPPLLFMDMLARQSAEEQFKHALANLIDLGYDPADVYDQIVSALDSIAADKGMENPYIEVGNIDFRGDEGGPKFKFEEDNA